MSKREKIARDEREQDQREYYEERAAILEYEANLPRREAERQARRMMRERYEQSVSTNPRRTAPANDPPAGTHDTSQPPT